MKVQMQIKSPSGAIKKVVKTFNDEQHRVNYIMMLFRKGFKVIAEDEVKF